MDFDLNKLLDYGLEIALISIVIVILIGIIKTFFKVKFGKVDWLKAVYQSLCVVLSFAGAVVYSFIKKTPLFTDLKFYSAVVSIIAAVQIVYSFYENYGLRKLFGLFVKCLYIIFFNDKIKSLAERLGIDTNDENADGSQRSCIWNSKT